MRAKEFISEAEWGDVLGLGNVLFGLSNVPDPFKEPDNSGNDKNQPAPSDDSNWTPPTGGNKGSALNEPDFMPALNKVASNLGIQPRALLGIMKLESGIRPQAVNATSKATGLIQFMPDTARGLGTSTQEIYNMTGTQQLPYVEKYLRDAGVKPGMDIGDIYIAVFYPAALGKGDNHVISSAGQKVYNQNKGLDTSRDGVLTVADVKQAAQKFA